MRISEVVKHILIVLLVSFVISMLIVFAKVKYSAKLMKKANFGVTKAASIGPIDNLFIGSSMFRQGIDIKALTPEGNISFLLAYNGNQPVLELEEIRRFYELGGKARVLVVDMYVYSLAAKPKLSDTRILLDDADGDYLKRIYECLKYGDADWTTYYQMAFQANNEFLLTAPLFFKMINGRYYNGNNLVKTRGASAERLARAALLPAPTEPRPYQAKALAELVKLCNEHGTTVLFIETPKYCKVIEEDAEYIRGMEKYVMLLNGLACQMIIHEKTLNKMQIGEMSSLRTYVFDNEDASQYMDLIHLSFDGRQRFSSMLKDFF